MMKKSILCLLLSIYFAAASAQDMVCVVTTDGDLHSYAISSSSGLQYNSENDTYTLTTANEVITYSNDDIKQIYFESKNVVDSDPYITPKASDKVNPNLVDASVYPFELVEQDKELGKAVVRFLDKVPNLYVGSILIFDDGALDVTPAWVLTCDMDGKQATIRYMVTPITSLVYNFDLIATCSADEARQALSQHNEGDNGNIVCGLDALKKPKLALQMLQATELEVTDEISYNLEPFFRMKLSEPISASDVLSPRKAASKVQFCQATVKGYINDAKTFSAQLNGKLSYDFDLPTPAFIKNPVSSVEVRTLVYGVPVIVGGELDLGLGLGLESNLDFEYEQTAHLEANAEFGFIYDGNTMKPVKNTSFKVWADDPEYDGEQAGSMSIKISFIPKLKFMVYKIFGFHLDLSPYVKGTAGITMKDGETHTSAKIDVGVDLSAGGPFIEDPFRKKTLMNDLATFKVDDLYTKRVWSFPAVIEDKTEKVSDIPSWVSFAEKKPMKHQVLDRDHAKKQNKVPSTGKAKGKTVEHVFFTDFPDYEHFGLGQPNTEIDPETGYHAIGKIIEVPCDNDGMAETTLDVPVPYGYHTLLKSRCLDPKGDPIVELRHDFPYEVKNFDAEVVMIADGMNMRGKLEYRNGGQDIDETYYQMCPYCNGNFYANYHDGKYTYTMHLGDGGPCTTAVVNTQDVCAFTGMMQARATETAGRKIVDSMRWYRDVMGMELPYGTTFEPGVYIAGYPCLHVHQDGGEMFYYQNLQMQFIGTEEDAFFQVTHLDILDREAETTNKDEHYDDFEQDNSTTQNTPMQMVKPVVNQTSAKWCIDSKENNVAKILKERLRQVPVLLKKENR